MGVREPLELSPWDLVGDREDALSFLTWLVMSEEAGRPLRGELKEGRRGW